MLNIKSSTRNALIANASLTALVPATNIKEAWPTSTSTYPLICYNTLDNVPTAFFDDDNTADIGQVEIHGFLAATATNGHTIATEIDRAMKTAKWVRYFFYDFKEDDGRQHYVMRYETTVFG